MDIEYFNDCVGLLNLSIFFWCGGVYLNSASIDIGLLIGFIQIKKSNGFIRKVMNWIYQHF